MVLRASALLIAAASGCAAEHPASPPAAAPPAAVGSPVLPRLAVGERIDLGAMLFLSGRAEFAPGGRERVRAVMGLEPVTTELEIEAFGDAPHLGGRPGAQEALVRNRGLAVQRELEAMGFRVRKLTAYRPGQTVRGRPPSRRIEIVVVAAP